MKNKRLIVAPSILSADFSRIREAIAAIENSGAEWIHLDIMDGNFVPNITFGPKFVHDLRSSTSLIFDTHLMINNPENFIKEFAEAGSDYITVHYEATVHLHRVIQEIKLAGIKAGVSLVPSTPVEVLEDILPELDQVLVMTVNPGFGGQSLIPFCIDKVAKLRSMCDRKNPNCKISVDGGVNIETISALKESGIDVVVTGSSFFSSKNPSEFVKTLIRR
ncbi:MAG: ribulose-phosphate 3-epimerase [Bacteroidetes bacterium]|nr:ribulose-phosphate 3-epimerase [Bacteroidota bacterium]